MMEIFRSSVKFGSIKPDGHKQESLISRIMPMPLPEKLILSLQQHQGAASRPCVKPGDRVLKYQRIAEASDHSSLPLHAPTSGTIESIDTIIQPFNDAASEICIVLKCDGAEAALELEPTWDYRTLNDDQLISRLHNAGLCGMGGAGFPTALKLRHAADVGVSTLIINAAECEPYITCDEALIRERAKFLTQGAEIIQAACGAARCVIGIESDKTTALAALRDAIDTDSIEIKTLAPKYPAGDESQLVYSITGKEAPESGLPLDLGILVVNAGTAAAAYDAIVNGKPCISRITTLTGTPLQTPKNFDVPIGTPVSHLLKLCGINEAAHTETILGGSLMGRSTTDLNVPIKKTNHCVIAASDIDFPAAPSSMPCIRCGYCANACPSHLLPQQLLFFAKQQDLEFLIDHGIADCIECGACAYVCPSKIPLVQYYRASKEAIKMEQHEQAIGEQWQKRFQYLQYRRKKSKADKLSPDKTKVSNQTKPTQKFSRDLAREEIAEAVARVKRKRSESGS